MNLSAIQFVYSRVDPDQQIWKEQGSAQENCPEPYQLRPRKKLRRQRSGFPANP